MKASPDQIVVVSSVEARAATLKNDWIVTDKTWWDAFLKVPMQILKGGSRLFHEKSRAHASGCSVY